MHRSEPWGLRKGRPRRGLPSWGLVAAAACTAGGVEGGGGGTSGTTGGGPTVVTFQVGAGDLCAGGAAAVHLRARKVGCIPPPPAPCTLPQEIPEILGPRVSCPIVDVTEPIFVQVEEPGRYYVDLGRESAGGGAGYACLAAEDGTVLHDVTTYDLDARATVTLSVTAAPCPDPP